MKFFIATFALKGKEFNIDAADVEFNKFKDWYRFAPNIWFVWTSLDVKSVYSILKPLLIGDQQLIVTELNVAHWYGWVTNDIGDWIRKPDRDPAKYTGD